MDPVEFRGEPGDLERFAQRALKRTLRIEELSPFEQRLRWDVGGSTGFSNSTRLRSGLLLSATKLTWEQPWTFQFVDAAQWLFRSKAS